MRPTRRLFSSGLLSNLQRRGFIHSVTKHEQLHRHLESAPRTIYLGIDPTATDLHLGHLFPIICANHFIHAGHRVLPIIGGATGNVGDPSGRTTAREPNALSQTDQNCYHNVRRYFQRHSRQPESGLGLDFKLFNNLTWWSQMSLLEFLRIVGANSKVNVMLTRDSVRSRLESQTGLPFSEFTYQLLQAYDFYHLYSTEGCTLQIGGADQWGNITEGLSLISRLENPDGEEKTESYAYGLTTPLLTTSSGQKLGKSAGNAIWLNKDRTSILDFYQYFLRLSDEDAKRYLPLFTVIPHDECDALIAKHEENASLRELQQSLARHVTSMVHGDSAVGIAEAATDIFYKNVPLSQFPLDELIPVLDASSHTLRIPSKDLFETPLIKLLAYHGILSSISVGRQLMKTGAIRVNGKQPMNGALAPLTQEEVYGGKVAVVKLGAAKHCTLLVDG
ncbi:hypothetical protein DL96DRAFT_1601272 [Flagelloscypha sp. PMI_526]|nr:hypothetical protein DL96DRAFT_1601272 [Flagelloscypha sp. PMI_526]